MIKIDLYIFFIIYGVYLLSVKANYVVPQCYKFTWVTPVFDNKPDRDNCSQFKGVPCIDPLIRSENSPNMTKLREENHLCNVTSGNVCVKYTFTYNNNIVNTSSFCGKVIEDKIIPITSGCYTQQIDGYELETCACQSRGLELCNVSMKINHSIILIITMLLLTFVNLT
ncbi:PREDICTED: uncharacterized protein LOC108546129 [Eufriesea mexicana]|uniref:uncharacterized protein LOC108546129 n=1 Tax=Eufriesea mexicana TaxID=516756 RepID=UPI00083C8188|nr:PREDICTED: uncharacterized protein LOC108546129 [Eufriesea mexicana]